MFEEADLIHSYTRADALRDGFLIDVTATAAEAGICWPVALLAVADPAFAGAPLPAPAPAIGVGVGAVMLLGIGYRALKNHIKR